MAGQQNEYTFDDIGNRTTTKAGGDESGANLRSATYTANSRNQYTSRTVPNTLDVLGIANSGATVTVNSLSTYRKGEYFRKELSVTNTSAAVWMGVSVTAVNGGSSNTMPGNLFVPQTAESLTYDADGNLAQDGHWDYVWDAGNQLTTIKTRSGMAGPVRRLEFEYDCQGRRIRKRVYDALSGGNLLLERRFLYDGWNVVAEVDGSNALVRSYLWGTDLSGSLRGAGGVGGLVAVKPSGGTAHFIAYDGNGSVAGLVDGSNATVSALYEYGPFGETIRVTDTLSGTNPFRFSTKYTDTETDFLYYGYRYYNPSTGRWLNRDPLQEGAGPNLYVFAANDSANHIDILGLAEAKTCCKIVRPLQVKLTAPRDILGRDTEFAGPADNPIWDKTRSRIWFTMKARFSNRCCEFRQQIRGGEKIDGKTVNQDRISDQFRDDNYSQEKDPNSYKNQPNGEVEFSDYDYPGFDPDPAPTKSFDAWMMFRGYVVDKCNKNQIVGSIKIYGFNVTGLSPNIKVETYGFDK